MTNEKLLKELRRIEADLLTERGEPAAFISVQKLINEVEDGIRAELNKQAGKGSVAKAAQRVLKFAQGHPRECFHKAYRGKKGVLICDGYRALRFNLDDAPALPEHSAGYVDYPDVDRIIGRPVQNSVQINVPTRSELLAYIKTEKARLAAKKDKSGVRLILTDGVVLIALNWRPQST